MDENKTTVIYGAFNPHHKAVHYVAIQTDTVPFHVYNVYITTREEDLPKLGEDTEALHQAYRAYRATLLGH